MGTNDNKKDDNASNNDKPNLSPMEIPELLAHIASYLSLPELGLAAQVSSAFHEACTPLLWRVIDLDGEEAEEIWEAHKGFRMGMIRYGRFVEELNLVGTSVQDGDLELIAENFTRLRRLNLSGTNVTEETLKVLIHSDPYKTLPPTQTTAAGGAKKRKKGKGVSAKRKGGARTSTAEDEDDVGGEGRKDERGLDDLVDDDGVDTETKMIKYRELTETETEHEPDSQYESMGVPNPSSTATESEQEQPTGSIPRPSAAAAATAAASKVKGRFAGKIPLHRQSGTTRPAKFKGTKTQFPFFLEELILHRCNNLTGAALKVIGRLGPQLKKLHMNHIAEMTDRDLLAFMTICPHLTEIHVKGTEVTDTFLRDLAVMVSGTINKAGAGNEARGRSGIESVNFDMTEITPAGLVPLIQVNKSTLKEIGFEHNHQATNEVLFAFIEANKKTTGYPMAKKGPRIFEINSVLTTLRASYCTGLSDQGLAVLFKHATELVAVEIDGSGVGDESLLALAATYRARMERLGLGVPAAWREYELADDELLIAEHAKKPSTAGAAALVRKTKGVDSTLKVPKVYHGRTVPAGLRRLSIKHCPRISNKGLRAIVRSCVNLERLSVSNCGRISVEIFNGPWACTQLYNLMIAGMSLELSKDVPGYAALLKEEKAERLRFPLKLEEYPVKFEFDGQGEYDYIVLPMQEMDFMDEGEGEEDDYMEEFEFDSGLEEGEEDEEDEEEEIEDEDEENDDEEDEEDDNDDEVVSAKAAGASTKPTTAVEEPLTWKLPGGKLKKLIQPPVHERNTNVQRALLKQFYTKLGLLTQLIYLDMSQCLFQVRAKEGLDLALPGLQKSLQTWNLFRPIGYNLTDSDLEFFGRYFGYGRSDCPLQIEKMSPEERHRYANQDDDAADAHLEWSKSEDLPRVAKLDQLIVSKYATEDNLDYDVYEWFMNQGIDLVQIDDFDYDMM
ncbi:hypothetical protein BGX23_003207 [Mortierella sp. AD031]|nr:hypothetical protein BGX23_003207 [Mortierella sp. AD031]